MFSSHSLCPVGDATPSRNSVTDFGGVFTAAGMALLLSFTILFGMQNDTMMSVQSGSPPHAGIKRNDAVAMSNTPPVWRRLRDDLRLPEQALDFSEAGMSSKELMARWEPYVKEASKRFALPVDWIKAVMKVESGGRTLLAGRPIESSAGALGVMQMMPDTYALMREKYNLGADVSDPHDNLIAGAAYLRELHKRYGYPNMFAAYNAGPGRLKDHLVTRRPLPAETQAYICNVTKLAGQPVKITPVKATPVKIVSAKHFTTKTENRVHVIYGTTNSENEVD